MNGAEGGKSDIDNDWWAKWTEMIAVHDYCVDSFGC